MNYQQCCKAAYLLDKHYLERFFSVKQKSDEDATCGKHLRWMIDQICSPGFAEDKALLWLGYIQGAMVARYGVPLENMQAVNKKAIEEGWDRP